MSGGRKHCVIADGRWRSAAVRWVCACAMQAAVMVLKNGEMVATVWAESIPYWSTASNVAVLSLDRGDQVWLLLLSRASYLHGYMYTTFSGSIVFELWTTASWLLSSSLITFRSAARFTQGRGAKKWHPLSVTWCLGVTVFSLVRYIMFAILAYTRFVFINQHCCLSANVNKFCFYTNELQFRHVDRIN